MTLNFCIPRLGVEDPAERYYPPQGNMSDVEYDIIKELTREQYGLNGTTWEQYSRYVNKLMHGDLGNSMRSGSPKVADLIAERIPWTLVLSVSTMLIGLICGLLFGAFAAWRRGRWPDMLLLNASTFTTALPRKKFKELRRNMQMIFQDPFGSLNPRFDLLEIIGEPMVIRGGYTAQEIEDRVVEMLELVGLSRQDLHRYPSDFSGGQRQRIGIARAIILNPSFLVCDEPVSALDVSVHAQILNLLDDIQKKSGITYLFISHNLAVVKSICDHMAVMYLGKVMECGSTQKIYNNTMHPYTKALLSAVLDIDVDNPRERIILQGDIPSPINPPVGCRFCQRCPNATEVCHQVAPKLVEIEEDHMIACHLYPECRP